ncbi:hypothetical protein ACFX1R_036176 [Malus domestica]
MRNEGGAGGEDVIQRSSSLLHLPHLRPSQNRIRQPRGSRHREALCRGASTQTIPSNFITAGDLQPVYFCRQQHRSNKPDLSPRRNPNPKHLRCLPQPCSGSMVVSEEISEPFI